MRNRLVILSGLPGSGKSTFVKDYSEQAKKEGYNVVVISSDEIRKQVAGSYGNMNHENLVWASFYKRK